MNLKFEQSRKLNTIQICLSPQKHPLSRNQWPTRLVRGAVLELNGAITGTITAVLLVALSSKLLDTTVPGAARLDGIVSSLPLSQPTPTPHYTHSYQIA